MEVYIDDMPVKSTTAELHIAHLAKAFQILKKYNMKLNPAKCAFGVSADKIAKFLKNCVTFAIKESEGGESIIYGSLNSA